MSTTKSGTVITAVKMRSFHFSLSFGFGWGPGNQHVGCEPDAEPVSGADCDGGHTIQETIQDACSGLAEALSGVGPGRPLFRPRKGCPAAP